MMIVLISICIILLLALVGIFIYVYTKKDISAGRLVSGYHTKSQTNGQNQRYGRSVEQCDIQQDDIESLTELRDSSNDLAVRIKKTHADMVKLISDKQLPINNGWIVNFTALVPRPDKRPGFRFLNESADDVLKAFVQLAEFIRSVKGCRELKGEFIQILRDMYGDQNMTFEGMNYEDIIAGIDKMLNELNVAFNNVSLDLKYE